MVQIDEQSVCYGCPRHDNTFQCTSYTPEGMDFRIRMGYCPLTDRWAEWRTDRPKTKLVKSRVGQQKQRKGK